LSTAVYWRPHTGLSGRREAPGVKQNLERFLDGLVRSVRLQVGDIDPRLELRHAAAMAG